MTEYDILGQIKRQSVPTEIDSSWNPAGDDYTRGWLWNYQEYDWKGRTTRVIPSDSTGSDGKDQLFGYEGCGCAGGEITTIQSESVPVPGQSYSERRKQKVYTDILGRTYKTEIMNWGGSTVYTTTIQTFNGRDQVTNTRQYSGSTSSQTYQDVTMTYDGFGRLKTRHYPVEDAQTETTWSYNSDDSISQIVDPRSVITAFTYDTRGLLTNISYTKPSNSTIPDAPSVTFSYDALGNRTAMTDGLGSVAYEYNQLSQLTAETRSFSDTMADAPLSDNSYRIEYGYNLSGELQWVKDPFDEQVDYSRDKIGRLTKVSGTAFGDDTTGEYVDGIQYRAFGAVKQMTYKTDDDNQISMQYDNRLRVSQHQVTTQQSGAGGYIQKAEFSYYNDSRPQFMDNQLNNQFDRIFTFDQAGRLTSNQFGNQTDGIPYTQTISYDAFSQMTYRGAEHWGQSILFTATYVNGRKQSANNQNPAYDTSGNQTNSGTRTNGTYQTTSFDEANRQKTVTTRIRRDYGSHVVYVYEQGQTQDYDGDGNALKMTETWLNVTQSQPQSTESKYQVWSSVLGSALTELGSTGAKLKTKVFAGGAVVAEQANGTTPAVVWTTADPLTGSSTKILKSGLFDTVTRKELEPFGQEVDPVEPPENETPDAFSRGLTVNEPEWLCALQNQQEMNFWDKAVLCQIAQMETEDPIKISVVARTETLTYLDSKTPNFGSPYSSPSDNVLTLAKRATYKSEDEKKSPTKIVEGGKLGHVEVNAEDSPVDLPLSINLSSIPGANAEYAGQQQTQQSTINHSKILNDVIGKVKNRIKNKPGCAKLLDNINVSEYLANNIYIGNKTPSGALFASELEPARTQSDLDEKGKRLASGQTGFNQDSFFFTGKAEGKNFSDFLTAEVRKKLGVGKLNIDEIKELIIIHELVHVNDTKGKYDDRGTSNPKLNKLIRKKCFD